MSTVAQLIDSKVEFLESEIVRLKNMKEKIGHSQMLDLPAQDVVTTISNLLFEVSRVKVKPGDSF